MSILSFLIAVRNSETFLTIKDMFKRSSISPNISANRFYKCWEVFKWPNISSNISMEVMIWIRCEGAVRLRLGTTIKMQIARDFFKRERMRNANNVGWGFQTTQNFKTMEVLATVTQYFWLESNFTQHWKCQCWVTKHSVQTIQHFTQHQCWVKCWIKWSRP